VTSEPDRRGMVMTVRLDNHTNVARRCDEFKDAAKMRFEKVLKRAVNQQAA